jgi:hypothetical protein
MTSISSIRRSTAAGRTGLHAGIFIYNPVQGYQVFLRPGNYDTLGGMIHFVPHGGGSIPADHLRNLIEYFTLNGLEHDVLDTRADPEKIVPGDAYVSCDLGTTVCLEPVRDQIFQVQLPHNLTGLKGTDFAASTANLNILPGLRFYRQYGIARDDPGYVLGGYAKWDRIYAERFLVPRRRREIVSEYGLRADLPWVVFYPTGPNKGVRGSCHKTEHIRSRLSRDIGRHEFVLCVHAQAYKDDRSKPIIRRLSQVAAEDSSIHVIDGSEALPFITACNLFMTDIASTLITALSMKKPVCFVAVDHEPSMRRRIREFQRGTFFNRIRNFSEYIESYRTPEALLRLFGECVAFDDDRNCERIADVIGDRYETWRQAQGFGLK